MITTQQAAGADAAFGTGLYRALNAQRNVVFSPASVAAALKMALAGARGETADELAAALRLNAPEDAATSLRELTGIKTGDDLTFRAPNTMWLDETLTVREDYVASLADTVAVERCDFRGAPDAAREAINTAVAKATEDKITGLIPRGFLGPLTRLVLVNAVYLNARWSHQFPADKTIKQPFFGGSGRVGGLGESGGFSGSSPPVAALSERPRESVLPTMHLRQKLAYHHGDGFQSALLPYQGGTLAMAIVLPDRNLTEFASAFDLANAVTPLLTREAECQVDLALPKFRVESSFRLEDTLQSLGVLRAFSDEADFGGISGERVAVDGVVHKAYLDVTEAGTEAAAATGMAFRRLALVREPEPDVRLVVDHPFLFAVVDTRTGLPLFLGQFTGPQPLDI